MKRRLLMLPLLVCLLFATAVSAQNGANIYDRPKVERYQADKRYDYNSQLKNKEIGWWDRFMRWLQSKMPRVINEPISSKNVRIVLIVIFVLILLGLLVFFIKQRPELFIRKPKTKKLPYEALEENIYEVNFDTEIDKYLKNNDLIMASRLVYLQTLRQLNDCGRIYWQPSKTPTEYIYEITAQKKPFRELTNHFLRIRYGNFGVDRPLFEQVRTLQQTVLKGEADA